MAAEALDTPDRAAPPTVADPPPVDTPEQLTPEQQEIAFLKEQLAQLSLAQGVVKQQTAPVTDDEPVIRIHFLEDGFTALSKIFYRGDELEFERDSQAYKDTFDKAGKSWLDYRYDEFGQVDRWGRIMFRNGPWPGKTYAAGTWENLRLEKGEGTIPPPTEEQLARAERLRQRREAPTLPAVDAPV